MRHKHIAVLRGGPSSEYDVSLRTGSGVLEALKNKEVKATDIIINRQGEWLVDGFIKVPSEALSTIDVVFIALHGSYGEDGTVQRLLERLAIPYTGSTPLPSSIAMNKVLTKGYLKDTSIKVPPHLKVGRDHSDLNRVVLAIEALFGPAYVIKPIDGGSSIDVYLAEGLPALAKALESALSKYEEVMVEKRIFGREATVGIIDNFRGQEHYSLPVIEIVPPTDAEFFTYEAKYSGESEEICPGRFSKEEKQMLEEAATLVHQTIGLAQYSRSDFIVADSRTGQEGGVYFLEVNTLPGLTTGSLLPKALNAVGFAYSDFVLHLLTEALNKS